MKRDGFDLSHFGVDKVIKAAHARAKQPGRNARGSYAGANPSVAVPQAAPHANGMREPAVIGVVAVPVRRVVAVRVRIVVRRRQCAADSGAGGKAANVPAPTATPAGLRRS